MDLVSNLVDEVKWRYKIGSIGHINAENVSEIAEEIYPIFGEKGDFNSPITFDRLIFETMMRL